MSEVLCVGRVSHNACIFLDNQQHSSLLVSVCVDRVFGLYEGLSMEGNLILKIHRNFFDDDVITVTSSVHTTQSICVLFSPPVFCHNSQVINNI